MPTRAYLAPITAIGNAFLGRRPLGIGDLPNTSWSWADGVSQCVVRAVVSDAQHATALATAGVIHLPFETDAGAVVSLVGGTFGDLSASNRTSCRARLEAENIPTQDFVASDPLRWALLRAVRCFIVRSYLGSDDFTEGLDTLVSAIPAAKRGRINTKLQARGYDTSVIVGSDMIREALRKLLIQDVAAQRTGDE